MDPQSQAQARYFKDFLQLYNRISELCFTKCVDNFFSRNVEAEEVSCVDSCVQKFVKFNQKMMSSYVEVQTEINTKRASEVEAQQLEALKNASKLQEESQSSIEINANEIPSNIAVAENATI